MDKLKANIWKHTLLGHDLDFIFYYKKEEERGWYHGAIKPERIKKITIKCINCNEILFESTKDEIE